MRYKRLVAATSAFRRNASGNAAAMFGITVLPVVFASGAALDYGRASSSKQALDRAADVATLAGARADSKQDKKALAESTFSKLASALGNVAVTGITTSASNQGKVKLQYTATVGTTLMKLAGLQSMTVGGDSEATSEMSSYADYYILFDTSASMGMGATPADTTKLINTLGCALACHTPENASNDTYPKARAAGINTRIDAARASVANLIRTLQSSSTKTGQFRVGLYPFVKKMKPLFSLSSNLPAALNATNNIQLDSTDVDMLPGGTNIETPLGQLNSFLPKSGDGSSAANPKIYVLLVSDGLNDTQDWNPYTNKWKDDAENAKRIHAFDPAACAPIKSKGIALGVLNVRYVKVTGPTWSARQDQVANDAIPQLAPALKTCASDTSLYFEATYAGEIDAAFQGYVTGTFNQTARFTQ